MDWTRALDQYCERTDASFLSEPLNFASNLAFFAAAFFLWKRLQNIPQSQRQPGSQFLVFNVLLIAIGSSLFHSFAQYWAMWGDVIPIGIFLFSYLFCFLKWQANLSTRGVSLGLLVFIVLSTVTSLVADHQVANGSEMYFGAWMSLFGIACYLLGKPNVQDRWLVPTAAISLSASLFLRTIDMRVCEVWPYGTHFGWHTLNGIVLYCVGRSYITSRQDLRHEL